MRSDKTDIDRANIEKYHNNQPVSVPPDIEHKTVIANVINRIEGLAQLIHTLDRVKERLNPDLELEGILLTMYDGRSMLNRRVVQEVQGFFREDVFETIIPRNIKLSEAPSFRMPGLLYDHTCIGSVAYMKLAREIMERKR